MSPDDVEAYLQHLDLYGIHYLDDGVAQDVVVVDQRTGFVASCDWAEVGHLDLNNDPKLKVTACRIKGSELDICITPDGWKHEGSLSQTFSFTPREHLEKSLTFLRHEDGLDVYMNKLTGKESYIGRTGGSMTNPNSAVAQLNERETVSNEFNLKEALKRDFDIDINISTGLGQSREDPIVILDTSPSDAAITEMNVLRGLGMGRRVVWKVLSHAPISHEGKILEQVKIESKSFSDTEIETLTTNFYFDIGLSTSKGEILPNGIAYVDDETKISMPFEIGSLHYKGIIHNEVDEPGLGVSILYGAPGIKATIYIYDMNIKDIPLDFSSSIVHEQYKQIVNDFKTANPKSIVTREAEYNTACIYEFFVTDETHEENALIALSVVRGKFVKLRITSIYDSELNKITIESFKQFQNIVGSYRSIKH